MTRDGEAVAAALSADDLFQMDQFLQQTATRLQVRPDQVDGAVRLLQDGNTICGMGDAAGYATLGILAKYRDEFVYWIENGRSKFEGNLECRRSS